MAFVHLNYSSSTVQSSPVQSSPVQSSPPHRRRRYHLGQSKIVADLSAVRIKDENRERIASFSTNAVGREALPCPSRSCDNPAQPFFPKCAVVFRARANDPPHGTTHAEAHAADGARKDIVVSPKSWCCERKSHNRRGRDMEASPRRRAPEQLPARASLTRHTTAPTAQRCRRTRKIRTVNSFSTAPRGGTTPLPRHAQPLLLLFRSKAFHLDDGKSTAPNHSQPPFPQSQRPAASNRTNPRGIHIGHSTTQGLQPGSPPHHRHLM